jgi:CubicO group peptidase (beta-lactamase class C family)
MFHSFEKAVGHRTSLVSRGIIEPMLRATRRRWAQGPFWPAALALALCSGVSAWPQIPPGSYTDERALPPGPRGERIRDLLDAIGSGDSARMRTFAEASFARSFLRSVPLEEHVDALLAMHDASGGLDFYGVRRYEGEKSRDREVVIARNRLTGVWEGISLEFESGAQSRITALGFLPARAPQGEDAGPLSLEQAVEELRGSVDRLAEAQAFSGAVLLAKDGQAVFEAARGEALRGYGVANRIDTKLNLGSMNKMFTAVAVAQLVEEGRLSWDDPVSKHLRSGWTRADLSSVRVKHLLSHTSGLGSYFNETYERSSRELFRELSDYKPLVAAEALAFEPGTGWQYSNTGFLLAGAVIEAVAGRSYFEHVRDRVYAPAGMWNTDCYDVDLVVPNLAVGYSRERRAEGVRWRSNLFRHVVRGGPAGGGFSTAPDLLAFANALRAGTLLQPASRELLWSAKPELGSPRYGYGFEIGSGPGGRSVGHGGGFPGISSNLDVFVDSGFTAVVLSNQDRGAEPVVRKIRELIGRVAEAEKAGVDAAGRQP